MEILQLRYFQALANNCNLTNTARMLYISPPALSASIARLEKELGTTLFDRVGNRMYLNPRGTTFLEYVDVVLNSLENAVAEVKEMEHQKEAILTIASTSPNAWSILFSHFCLDHPEIKLINTFLRLNQVQPIDLQSKFDLLIANPGDVPFHRLESSPLYRNDVPLLLVRDDHPFAQKKTVRLIEAKDESFVALDSGYSSRKYFDMMCTMAGFAPHIVVECDYTLRSHMVIQGVGIAFTTGNAWKNQPAMGLTAVEIVDPYVPREQALFWDSRHYKNHAADVFRDYATRFFANYSYR